MYLGDSDGIETILQVFILFQHLAHSGHLIIDISKEGTKEVLLDSITKLDRANVGSWEGVSQFINSQAYIASTAIRIDSMPDHNYEHGQSIW